MSKWSEKEASIRALEQGGRVDPWDAYPSLRENVRAYSHLDGIALPHNPPHW